MNEYAILDAIKERNEHQRMLIDAIKARTAFIEAHGRPPTYSDWRRF